MSESVCEIVITGAGAISAYGLGRHALAEGLQNKSSCEQDLTLFEATHTCERAVEVGEFDYAEYIFSTQPYVDRTTALALVAARLCLDDAGIALPVAEDAASPMGLCMGTCWGCMESVERFSAPLIAGKPKTAQGLIFTHSFPNSPASILSIEYGLRGFSTVHAGRRLAGLWALDAAVTALQDGQAARMLVGAADALSPAVYEHYHTLGQVAAEGEVAPLAADSPGTIPGEGAAFVLLETRKHAEARHAAILGRLQEVGLSGRAHELVVSPEASVKNIISCAPGVPEIDREEMAIFEHLGMEPDRALALARYLGDTLSVQPIYGLIAALTSSDITAVFQADDKSAGLLICQGV